MKKINYTLLLFFALPVLYKLIFEPDPMPLNLVGITAVIILIILLFELLERTRVKRVNKWTNVKGSRIKSALFFSALIGIPISVIISLLISISPSITDSLLFIILPITIMFGFIGSNEWSLCYKLFLENKYSTKL